jgi:MFS family permease
MLSILADRRYRRLFMAQLAALLGSGLATVALGLLAYDLAGERAALVLGLLFTIKMIAYVTLAPLAGALAERLPRRGFLVALDALRAAVVLALPFVTALWQVCALVFLLQAASAAFTPAYQATLPDVLPEEDRYTRALSLSRLAYDLENIASPLLAGLLLSVLSYHALFLGTVAGFVISAALVLSVVLPSPRATERRSFLERTTRGLRLYLATPRLRGLLALNAAAAAGGAMVLVNSVVLVRGTLARPDSALAWAMGAFGAGSMLAALALPRLLERRSDRPVMLAGAVLLCATLALLAATVLVIGLSWGLLLAAWLCAGLGYGAVLTPSGRLLRRSAHPEDRPAIFAAQFALSHACWLVTYPLAGLVMTHAGTVPALLVLAALAAGGIAAALRLWPGPDLLAPDHRHDDLPADHPHLAAHGGSRRHAHPLVIDRLHPHWPV